MNSLGLIETRGLSLGIEAIDAAVKAANVTLESSEQVNGEGRILFRITGDVGAVKAAVDAAKGIVMQKNGVVYTRVIARPSAELEKMLGFTKPEDPKTKDSACVENTEEKQAENPAEEVNEISRQESVTAEVRSDEPAREIRGSKKKNGKTDTTGG